MNIPDKSQLKAIRHGEGPMLVLAGPGSGKTFVVTKRVENLINEYKVSPGKILVITFTRTAAGEMRDRFLTMNPDCRGVTFGTFHAVFFMILKNAYGYTAENIIREDERFFIMKNLIRQLKLEYEDENDFIGNIFSEISLIKNTGIELSNYYSTSCGTDEFRRLYVGYDKALRRTNKIDFDDMLTFTYELFDMRKDILAMWQRKFEYILIDEFQDVNKVQYDIALMLAGKRANLFMVGDDDQSIYRFRGADPKIMLNIKDDFKNLKTVNLSVNYRCPENITDVAMQLISQNSARYEKDIISRNQGGRVVRRLFEDQWKESDFIIKKLREYEDDGIDLNNVAVLFRVNTGCRLIAEKFTEYNITFQMRDSFPSIYDHWMAKDIFAYMDIAHGSRKREDFLLIINRPKRYISRESLEYSEVAFDVWQAFYSEQPWIEKRIEDLQKDLKFIKKLSPFAAVNYIRKSVGYDEFIKEYATFRHINKDELFDTLDELTESAKPFDTYEKWLEHIVEFKDIQKKNKEMNPNTDGVSLLTFHSAKGLEFEKVFIIDMNEDVIPYKKAVLPEDIEEERRMLYVGMTRAISELYLLSAKKIHGKEADDSQFLYEMDMA
ncbi:MAG: ATP-dependent helicase [Lachnospiraceae bacterium]|nr:ATP-dependent helicase [Lachnospiraceae bacterium]